MSRILYRLGSIAAAAIVASAHAAYPPEKVMALNYPEDSLARGEQGVVGITVKIDRRGLLSRCAVSASSGYASLDRAACRVMVERVRLKPERVDGERASVVRAASIVWELPALRRAAIADAPPHSSAGELVDAARPITCHRSLKPGSLRIMETLCVNDADWRRVIDYAQSQVHAWTDGGSGSFMPY